MPTAPTLIPALPTPVPQTSDPTNFDTRADALLTALPDTVDGMNDAADNVYANAVEAATAASDIAAAALVAADAAGLVGKSTTSLSVSAGSKAVTLSSAKASLAVAGKQVAIVNVSDASIKMFGNIAASPAPTSTTFTVTVVTSGVFGSGTYAAWEIIDAAFFATGATAAEILAGETDAAATTPLGLSDSLAFLALTDAATVSWDTNAGVNARLTLGGNRTIAAPTNLKDGWTYVLNIDPATYTPSWNAIFNFGAVGAPDLPASVWSKLVFQYDDARTKLDVSGLFFGA